VFSWLAFAYFVVYGVCQIAFTFIAWRSLAGYRHSRAFWALDEVYASPFTPPVSILLPAYNEEAGVVASVHSLLDLRYPRHEVIVVNDGSRDGTLDRLCEAFALVPVREALRTQIATAPVRAAFVSRTHPNLWVLDKENGGKSDALNAGINAASHPYFCAIDADAVLEQDSLLRMILPFVDDPDLVAAAGGIVRVANGAVIESGRLVDFRLPAGHIARFQILEYFRAFLIGRLGFDRLNAVLIISGAFGLFKRELVEAVGGYAHNTVGEDAELVARLHGYLRQQRALSDQVHPQSCVLDRGPLGREDALAATPAVAAWPRRDSVATPEADLQSACGMVRPLHVAVLPLLRAVGSRHRGRRDPGRPDRLGRRRPLRHVLRPLSGSLGSPGRRGLDLGAAARGVRGSTVRPRT
jgi:glycosyltransferase involved in cell wall biosynthesis